MKRYGHEFEDFLTIKFLNSAGLFEVQDDEKIRIQAIISRLLIIS